MMCCKERHPLLLECLITLPSHIRMIGRASVSIYKCCHGQHRVISAKNDSQISCKMSDFGHPLCAGNNMMCCKERHPLLLECFIPFFRGIRMIRKASGSIYKPVMVNSVPLLTKATLKFHVKYQLLGPLSEQEMGCCDAMRDIYYCLGIQ